MPARSTVASGLILSFVGSAAGQSPRGVRVFELPDPARSVSVLYSTTGWPWPASVGRPDGEAGAHRGSDRQGFAQGYSNRLKSRRGGAALKGGAVGIGAGLVGLYLLVSAVCVGRDC